MKKFCINTFDYLSKLPRDPRTPQLHELTEDVMRVARNVPGAAYSLVVPEIPPQPELHCVSPTALSLLDFDVPSNDFHLKTWADADQSEFTAIFSGAKLPADAQPWSHNYAGHQFGQFAGQLGDGRAISLGEVRNKRFEIWESQLKGAGNTPYSRFADGFAVLRSSIREFVCSEHFHALGIPTSRASSLITTGQMVHREELEPGAIVTRLAPSWIRFGSFENFAMRGDICNLARLADFTLERFFPNANGSVINMLEEVVQRTALLIAKWDLAAWGHGVMNTDNMSILGLTIDYGPFSFYDIYDPDHIFNHSDSSGRYTLRNQRLVGLWNLAKLSSTLVELIGRQASGQTLEFIASEKAATNEKDRAEFTKLSKDQIMSVLGKYDLFYEQAYFQGMQAKLGLTKSQDNDQQILITPLLNLLERARADYTIFFRTLCDFDHVNNIDPIEPLLVHFTTAGALKEDSCHVAGSSSCPTLSPFLQEPARAPAVLVGEVKTLWNDWKAAYIARVTSDLSDSKITMEERRASMKQANPKFVFRQWIAQKTIESAQKGDAQAVARALAVMRDPFADKPDGVEQYEESAGVSWWEEWAKEPPAWGQGIVCSCSS